MSGSESKLIYKELSHEVIGAAMKVHTTLGSMLPENCYETALQSELTSRGIMTVRQKQFEVYYNEVRCGHFFTDLIVENKIVLELKSAEDLYPHHESQLYTYLRTTGLHVGYLLNFGLKSLQFKRRVLF